MNHHVSSYLSTQKSRAQFVRVDALGEILRSDLGLPSRASLKDETTTGFDGDIVDHLVNGPAKKIPARVGTSGVYVL